MNEYVDLYWSVMGDRLRADHNYRLYAALVGANQNLKQVSYRMNAISGVAENNGWIKLNRQSKLIIRCKYQDIHEFDALDNSIIRVGQNIIQLTFNGGQAVSSKPALTADIVTIKCEFKCRVSPFEFGVAVGKQLQSLGILSMPRIGDRKSLQIKESNIIGYAILFDSLTPAESLMLQAHGIGGRAKMGCGFFATLFKAGSTPAIRV
jgi:CRISPR-associated protein Cas6